MPEVESPDPSWLCEVVRLEPFPDVLFEGGMDVPLDPEARHGQTESVALSFVTQGVRESPGAASVRLRIDLAYDGSGFHGFARQPDVRTVQGVLEAALSRLVQRPVTTTGAGRTDAGVHARRQVVTCDVPTTPPFAHLARLRDTLDRLCGPDLTIWSVQRAPAGFDARFSASSRRYAYWICDVPALDPLQRRDVWHLGPPPLDLDAMRSGARHLVGEHDFSSFCRRSGDQHLIRRIDRLDLARVTRVAAGEAPDLVRVEVEGPAFCHQMVRSVVGCLVQVGRHRRDPATVADVLAARNRQAADAIAPPHGLVFLGPTYP